MRISVATALVLALATVAVALTGCTGEAPLPLEAAPAVAPQDEDARETCSSRSFARFPGAYEDAGNLVAGPLALVGGGTWTSEATALAGQKYPLLVRAGHEVAVELPSAFHGRAALAYGPLPQGQITVADGHARVTFTACGEGVPTFWSGGIVVAEPACLPLDVFIDGRQQARRVEVELGRRC